MGLPECLFNSGYTRLSAFALHLAQFYDDKIHWAFSSKVKETDLASDDNGDVIVTVGSEGGISFDSPVTFDDVTSFMSGMKLCYNNGNGVCDIVTFLGIDYIDDMQMVCLICRSDNSELLVVPEILNFVENPDIASIPQTNEEYYEECHYLDPSDLEQIVRQQALSPLQEEMMSFHSCRIVAQFVCPVCLALHTNVRGDQSLKRNILFKRNLICLLAQRL